MEEKLSQDQKGQTEKAGILRFFREMGSALGMALIAIVYVIQAFQIPTGSMENSLLVGDFLLGLKFVYGAPIIPFSQELGITKRLPAIKNPKAGDVVIFKYPGTDSKDYIKRAVAGPGDIVEIRGNTKLIVNGTELKLPPKGKYTGQNRPDTRITNFAPLYIPKKGDVINSDTLPIREFLFFKHLVHQENPTKNVYMHFDLYLDGELSNTTPFNFNGAQLSLQDLQSGKLTYQNEMTRRTETFDFNKFDDWTALDYFLEIIRRNFPDKKVEFSKKLFMNTNLINSYSVRFDNYFMVGDNRDNSLDSRYWGYLNRNFVKAQAFILYFSLDRGEPMWKLPLNIRWNRIGKLIRSWDGVSEYDSGIKY
ncbi:MAG: signal peptidase I [Chitinispirillales bacterium]|jgi:signal peptidase I|nr:signal peptidase I [Chitinispirillales bacterium]